MPTGVEHSKIITEHQTLTGWPGLSVSLGIAASAADTAAIARREPGCCLAEYLVQPVAAHTPEQP